MYAFTRRRGHDAAEAQDLAQEFFTRFLARHYFDGAEREKGNFRTFLLTCLKCFLADQNDHANAQKRGGGVAPLPFEISTAESLYTREPSHNETPGRIYERRWARALLDRVYSRLREEFVRHGRLDHFNHLKAHLMGSGDAPYADLAAKLGVTEGVLKTGIHRLRKRYRDLLREEVAATVAGPFGPNALAPVHSTSGAENAGELQEASQVLTEARGILAGLDRAGTLPASSRDSLISLGNDLATVNAKLVAAR